MTGFAAVVLTGGAARRLGGVDKTGLTVGGRPMRDRVLAAVADAAPRIVVGPDVVGVPPDVRTTRETPAGGGPAAAIAAGLALLPTTRASTGPAGPSAASSAAAGPAQPSGPAVAAAGPARPSDPAADTVALLAGDLPLLTRDAVAELRRALAADPSVDGVCFLDADGRRQQLCGVWRVPPLRAAVDRLAAERGGTLAGASVRALLAGLGVGELRWSGRGAPPWFDCDTDEDVRRAEEWTR
ncbi:NTP transferase domain-containing protein [Micromonospora sp. WMMD882]|uniref:molybdenum cofactor guanylyltransferase n=1 Tax=Micromonospora sp. WMMD882 TaxID=3015151 RepID=UPI00248C06A2|nr:NTP transferase domain-containing protein [Micromonospora sp. WMMD882]WBB78374.1 NTP transferase domain-containing protein [Micromonospora sp. WMMD882]